MVIVVVAATGEVEMANTGDVVAPAGTVTETGTVTPGSLLLRSTVAPPAGAGPFSVTRLFPAVVTPPTTEAGDNANVDIVSGSTVREALSPAPL